MHNIEVRIVLDVDQPSLVIFVRLLQCPDAVFLAPEAYLSLCESQRRNIFLLRGFLEVSELPLEYPIDATALEGLF